MTANHLTIRHPIKGGEVVFQVTTEAPLQAASLGRLETVARAIEILVANLPPTKGEGETTP